MKKVFAILAIVALASCGGSESAAPAADSTATVDTAVVAPVDTTAVAADSAAVVAPVDSAAAAK